MNSPSEDVAIIGMSCIFPGAPDLDTFWRNILAKFDAVGDPPPNLGFDEYFEPDASSNDRIYCKKGGFIEEYAEFDPIEFGIMPNAVEGGNPAQFLALRFAREAIVDAGYLDRTFDRERTALILGHGLNLDRGQVTCAQHGFWVDQTLAIIEQLKPELTDAELSAIREDLKKNLPPFKAETCPGLISNILTGRIANRLDLKGPNFTVDAACASSLIAIDLGVRELQSGRSNMVIAGGVQVGMPPQMFMVFCLLGALSRRGKIRPFDKNADGTLLGEGIGMMVLKRLRDAERDKDRIYALVKSVGVASNGRSKGVLVPRVEGELLALERAYEASEICPQTIGLIEAHGTGTDVGDAVEIDTLTRFLGTRRGPLPRYPLGSIKSMISHTIPSAGMAGLIKSTLALYHKILPPTLCDEPDAKLEREKTPLYVNTETRPWVHGGRLPRRVGINAFGFGGINAHAILEDYTGRPDGDNHPAAPLEWDQEVLIFQGETRQDLIKSAERIRRMIAAESSVNLKDLAYTLNTALGHSEASILAIVAGSPGELDKKLEHALKRLADPHCDAIKDRSGIYFFAKPLGRQGKLAFLFPGEGAQYTNMLSDLCLHFPDVRASFDRADRLFLERRRQPLPSQVVFPPPLASAPLKAECEKVLLTLEYAVSTLFAANQGLLHLFQSLKIRPHVVAGHSCGGDVALLASGILAENDDERIREWAVDIEKTNRSVGKLLPKAQLLAVGGADQALINTVVESRIGKLFIAMDNCPNQMVLGGSETAVSEAHDFLKAEGAICRFLPFDRPYHTPLYQPICDLHSRKFVRELTIHPPNIEIYSCATGQPFPRDEKEIRRILAEQWAMPVRFRETVEAMYAAGVRIFMEVGPGATLISFVEDTLRERPHMAVAANIPNRPEISHLNHLIAILAAQGITPKLDSLYEPRAAKKLSLHRDTIKTRENTAQETEEIDTRPGTVKLTMALPKLSVNSRKSALLLAKQPAQRVDRGASSESSRMLKRQDLQNGHGVSSTEVSPGGDRPRVSRPGHEAKDQELHSSLEKSDAVGGLPPEISAALSQFQTQLERLGKCQNKEVQPGTMDEYFKTMEQFIDLQQHVMTMLFKTRAPKDDGNFR